MHIAEEEHIADKTRSQAECGLSMDFLSSTDHLQYAGRSRVVICHAKAFDGDDVAAEAHAAQHDHLALDWLAQYR